jgi:hypothetical protein
MSCVAIAIAMAMKPTTKHQVPQRPRAPQPRDPRERRPREPDDRAWREIESIDGSWTPWLLIQCSPDDLGFRPIPASMPEYLSPAIWIESSDIFGRAVAGEVNTIHATVFNLGSGISAPTQVNFFWADPSLGLGPGNFTRIEAQYVEIRSLMEGGGAIELRCPWVPEYLNNGHECLQVHCTNPILDPDLAPFQPRIERHVAQRNVTVLHAGAGVKLEFLVSINNAWPTAARTVINGRAEHLMLHGRAEHWTPRDLIGAAAAFGVEHADSVEALRGRYREGTDEARAVQRVVESLASRRERSARPVLSRAVRGPARMTAELMQGTRIVEARGVDGMYERRLRAEQVLKPAGRAAGDAGAVLMEGLSLRPFEQRKLMLHLQVPADARPGEFVVFHATQMAEQLQVGGYAIVVRVT